MNTKKSASPTGTGKDAGRMTPLFEQYSRIKAEHPDSLLFYRMGDFYEMFFDDAVTASRELQIALTSRGRDEDSPPMCGVPWHAASSYIAQLVSKGYSVAICDQVEDPRTAKGIVRRAVTRVISPGTVLEDDTLEPADHTFLGSLFFQDADGKRQAAAAFAWADISTGQWSGVEFRRPADVWPWLQKIAPKELIIPDRMAAPPAALMEGIRLVRLPDAHYDPRRAEERVLEAQGVRETAALGLNGREALLLACAGILAYLERTQKCAPSQLQPFRPMDPGRRLIVDETSARNLEIFRCLDGRRGRGTLRHVVDATVTPMGGRFMEDMLRHPWRDPGIIARIQDAVAFFHGEDARRDDLREALRAVHDIERISTRITLNRAMPRDFTALGAALSALPGVLDILTRPGADGRPPDLPSCLAVVVKNWDSLADCADLLTRALEDNLPAVVTEGGLFRQGYHEELDELLDLAEHGEQKLQEMLEHEQRECGLPRLRLGCNRVFGYYYELGRSAQGATVPDRFIRRQTLANAERFTTEELKALESGILSAAERRKSLEYSLFQQLRARMADQRERLVHMADVLAQIDYWQALAHVGRRNEWVRPVLNDGVDIAIVDGRHPVVEAIIGAADFVPNSLSLDAGRRLCLLTGPNMAGKSTVLRQTALICLLAQMGSMVPAASAEIGVVDRIFSRVGASDNLARGQSTFMVEMMETARILRQAGRRSLVILDEIGRGTSTFDGVAIAWAVVENLAGRADAPRTVFATHYHELTALEGRVPGVFTMNSVIREHNNEILFLHKLAPGPADRSYGVDVARLAGVPDSVVRRARALLAELERGQRGGARARILSLPGFSGQEPQEEEIAPSPLPPRREEHPLLGILREIDVDVLSPERALKLIREWRRLWIEAPPRRDGDGMENPAEEDERG